MIHISLSPNLETDDVLLSLKWLFSPWRWQEKGSQKKLKENLKKRFPEASEIFLFNSGRAALMMGLKALNLPPKSQVFLPSFTCSAVPNAILWNNLTPVYLDINRNDYNLDPRKLPKTPKAKALIIQHTFGQAGNLKEILAYCQKHKLYLIEDCAHSLGAKFEEKPLGSFGDMALLSFGRDKVISSVFGGALVVNNQKLTASLESLYRALPYPSFSWTTQQLFHPPLTFLAKKTYSFGLGKAILFLAQKIGLVSKAIYPEEHRHQTPPFFPKRLPEPLSDLANHQLEKLDRFNQRRRENACYYHQHLRHPQVKKPFWNSEGIYLRYTILLDPPEKLKAYLKKNGIIIEKRHWYTQPVTPSHNLRLANYQKGQCPVAEEICRKCLNLPNNPTLSLKEIKHIVKLINQWRS